MMKTNINLLDLDNDILNIIGVYVIEDNIKNECLKQWIEIYTKKKTSYCRILHDHSSYFRYHWHRHDGPPSGKLTVPPTTSFCKITMAIRL